MFFINSTFSLSDPLLFLFLVPNNDALEKKKKKRKKNWLK